MACFPNPSLVWSPAQGEPVRNSGWTLPRKKTRGMGPPYGENCTILTSTIFDWSTRLTDGQTDRRTGDSIWLGKHYTPWFIKSGPLCIFAFCTFCNCNYITPYKEYLKYEIANHITWKQISYRIQWCNFQSNRSPFEKVIAKIQSGPDFMNHVVYAVAPRALKTKSYVSGLKYFATIFTRVRIAGDASALSTTVLWSGFLVTHCYDQYHVSDALTILPWLRLSERVNFKQALMAYRVLNGMAPPLSESTRSGINLPGRRHLRSLFTLQLHVPKYRLSTAGRRSFFVAELAASIFWNTLPDDVRLSLPSGDS